MIAFTGVEIHKARKNDANKSGMAAYGLEMGSLCILMIATIVIIFLSTKLDATDLQKPVWWAVGAILFASTVAFVQKVFWHTRGWVLYYKLDPGDFGYTLLDGVTTMIGREPAQEVMGFDNEEILEIGQRKGFSISMYMGLNYSNMTNAALNAGNGYKWNKANDTLRIPLFVRGQTFTTDLKDYGIQVVDKSPLIWLVLDNKEPTDDVAIPFLPRFEMEFNHTQPPGNDAAESIDELGQNACKTIDGLTAKCKFYDDSATFDAYEDAQSLRIDPCGPANARYLKHMAFVFEEDFVGNNKMRKDHVTRVSVYIGNRLKQTHTFPGTVRISDNSVSILPKALYRDSSDIMRQTTKPHESPFLQDCRLGYVKYFSYPLSEHQIKEFASRKVPLTISDEANAMKAGNRDTNIAPGRSA
eukprot:gene19584-26267_t